MNSSRSSGLNAEPNVIPMIDVMLVLIVCFMVIKMMTGRLLELQLPQDSAEGPPGVPLVLTVGPGPAYALNGSVIAPDRLGVELSAVYRDRPEKILFVNADRRVRYQDVIAVFDAVRGAGVRVTAIQPPRQSTP